MLRSHFLVFRLIRAFVVMWLLCVDGDVAGDVASNGGGDERASSFVASGFEMGLEVGLEEAQKIYIRNLELLPTRVNLTFVKADKDTLLGRYHSHTSSSAAAAATAGGSGGGGGFARVGGAAAALSTFVEILVGATGSISNAPLKLQGYKV